MLDFRWQYTHRDDNTATTVETLFWLFRPLTALFHRTPDCSIVTAMNRIPFFAFLITTVMSISCAEMVMAQSGSARTAKPARQEQAAPADGWFDVLPGGIAAQMRMPTEPRHIQRTMTPDENTEITLDTFMSTVRDGNLSYVYSHFVMLDTPVGKKAVGQRFDQAVRGQVLRVGGEVDAYSEIENGPHQGREFVYRFSDDKGNDYKAHVRLFMRLDSMHEIKVIALEKHFSEQGAAKFFDSFRFSKKNPMPEPTEEAAEKPAAEESP